MTSWNVFDFMTKFWHIDIGNNEFLVIMTCVDIMTNFITSWFVYNMTHFGCDKHFGAMTYVTLIHVITNVLTSWNFLTTWQSFWRLDALFDVMTCFCLHDKLFNVMTYFWLYDTLFDIMTYFLLHDKLVTSWQTFWRHGVFLMSWRTLWRHDELGDVMTNFVTSLHLFYFMINFVTS